MSACRVFMRAWLLLPALALLGSPPGVQSQTLLTSASLVVNEVLMSEGSGGGASSFIELYNPTASSVSIDGWSLDVWSGGLEQPFSLPNRTIAPHGFFLVASSFFVGLHPEVTPDFVVPTISLGDAGSVVLLSSTHAVVDTVGWTPSVLFSPHEGQPAPSPGIGYSIARIPLGQDTDDNGTDFQIGLPTPSTSSGTGNQPPVFQAIPAPTISEGATVWFGVHASDPEGGSVTLSAGALPSGAQFDPATGLFSWFAFVGASSNSPYSASFSATDAQGASSAILVTITVVVPQIQVTITSPTTGPTYAADASPLLLAGGLSEAVGAVTWRKPLSGESGSANTSNESWSASVPLTPGFQIVQILVIEGGTLMGMATLQVTYTPLEGGIILTTPLQITDHKGTLVAGVEVALSGNFGIAYLGGQLLVLAPDGTVRGSTGIVPSRVTNGAQVTLSFSENNLLGKAKAGDTLLLNVNLTGVNAGQITLTANDSALVQVVAN